MTKHSGIFRQSDVGQAIADNNWVGIAPPNFEYLIVAGGGGSSVGGGGAGGLLAGFSGITVGITLWVTVGSGAAGGSGIVIIRYPQTLSSPTSVTGDVQIGYAAGYQIYTWTSSGTVTF